MKHLFVPSPDLPLSWTTMEETMSPLLLFFGLMPDTEYTWPFVFGLNLCCLQRRHDSESIVL